jgi:hypothetical protein
VTRSVTGNEFGGSENPRRRPRRRESDGVLSGMVWPAEQPGTHAFVIFFRPYICRYSCRNYHPVLPAAIIAVAFGPSSSSASRFTARPAVEPHPFPLFASDNSEAVVLDLVNPQRP